VSFRADYYRVRPLPPVPNISDPATQLVVQISSNLLTWTDLSAIDVATNSDGAGESVTYTLTGASLRFVRLKVTPN